MNLLSKSITDPQKNEEAKKVIIEFRKKIRECDDAASDNNISKVLDLYPYTASLLNNFLTLLQDVPDEI
jgi:hypothetical protein